MKKIIVLFLTLFSLTAFGQPQPFYGTLLFNLMESERSLKLITPNDLESKNITFLSYSQGSELKYDTINKAFSFKTYGFENKKFAIVYKNETIFIDYPSLPFVFAIFVKAPIPLSGKSFSFFNEYTYDAINTNHYYNEFRIFYLCQGCFLEEQYEMSKERKKIMIEWFKKAYTIKLQE